MDAEAEGVYVKVGGVSLRRGSVLMCPILQPPHSPFPKLLTAIMNLICLSLPFQKFQETAPLWLPLFLGPIYSG